jgi:hypothetical protein
LICIKIRPVRFRQYRRATNGRSAMFCRLQAVRVVSRTARGRSDFRIAISGLLGWG